MRTATATLEPPERPPWHRPRTTPADGLSTYGEVINRLLTFDQRRAREALARAERDGG